MKIRANTATGKIQATVYERQTSPMATALIVLFLTSTVFVPEARAHDGETPRHYVAASGSDDGDCASPSSPCLSIDYAMNHAGKGDTILVATGRYRFREEDPEEMITLLSPIVQVRGGYRVTDGFEVQDMEANPTVIIGVPDDYSAPLKSRGFIATTREAALQDLESDADIAAPDSALELAQADSQQTPRDAAGQEVGAESLADIGTPRYVLDDGAESGNCDTPDSACGLARALEVARSGDSVLIAEGSYEISPELAQGLTRPDITVVGGVSPSQGFARSRDANSAPAYVTGPSFEQRDALAARGLTLIQDRKGLAIRQSRERLTRSSNSEATLAATPCDPTSGMAGPFPCKNIDLLSRMPLTDFSSRPTAANDIWGFVDQRDNREYAIIGLFNGTAVVDVTDPENPAEVGTVGGRDAQWRDIKVYQFRDADDAWQAYAYVTADNPVGGPQGLQIIDLSGLPSSIILAATWNRIDRAHNVYIANVDYSTGVTLPGMTPFAYIAGSNRNSGAALALDLSDPTAPSEVLVPSPGTQYIHDGTSLLIDDARVQNCKSGTNPPAGGHNPCELFVDFNENTLDLWDVTDKTQPLMISSTPYPDANYTHSGWWSADKRFIFLQDELDEQAAGLNTTVRTFDISDLNMPVLSGVWSGPTRAIDHNSFTVGDLLYLSNYRRGLTILDVTDPNSPSELGFFDTFPSPSANTAQFNGAWGTYPFLPSGTLLVSDIEGGLFVLRQNGSNVEEEPDSPGAYEYAVKVVCGRQRKEESGQLVRGRYGTVINIGNSGTGSARFRKRLALTIPPGEQRPGETTVYGNDQLEPMQALKTDCRDIAEQVFNGSFPGDFIEGFVIVRSDTELDVSVVYTAGGIADQNERAGGVDVEYIEPRVLPGQED